MASFDGSPDASSSSAAAPAWQAKLLAKYRARGAEERAAIKARDREATDAEFERLMADKAAADRSAHASFAKIPRFFAGGRRLQQKLRALAEAKGHAEFERKILSWDELEELRVALGAAQSEPMDGSGRINYEQLCEIRRDLEAASGSDIFHGPLSARKFLQLPRDQHSRISARDLYNRVDRETCVAKTQLTMRPYDGSGKGYLREHELERYIYVFVGAGNGRDVPDFKGSDLGRFPLASADSWTSDHVSERSRSVDDHSGTRARGTLTLKRTRIARFPPRRRARGARAPRGGASR